MSNSIKGKNKLEGATNYSQEGEEKAGGNIMEAKIKDKMAEGGGEKYQVLPQNNYIAENAQLNPFHTESQRVEANAGCMTPQLVSKLHL